MRDRGLVEVSNPSEYFLTERPEGVAGSVVVASIEGTRPILVEVQALVVSTSFGMPRRTAIGVDANRVSLLVAVLDKVGGLHLGNHDIFVNVAGGVRLSEPAVDLGITAAIASSFLDRPIDPKTVVFGEVGLTGEVRGINQMEVRVREAERMGFSPLHPASHAAQGAGQGRRNRAGSRRASEGVAGRDFLSYCCRHRSCEE